MKFFQSTDFASSFCHTEVAQLNANKKDLYMTTAVFASATTLQFLFDNNAGNYESQLQMASGHSRVFTMHLLFH